MFFYGFYLLIILRVLRFLSVGRARVRSKRGHLCHQFGSRSAHGFDREAPCPRQPARASPAVRRAKGHGSVFRANHRETPSDEIGRRALSGSRFGRSAFNALTLWRKALRDVSVSVRRNRTRRRRLGTYRPGNPDGRLIERRRHRPDASRDRLPSRTARRRAQINRAGIVARPRPRGLTPQGFRPATKIFAYPAHSNSVTISNYTI
jgi:hypothetical protein